MFNINLFFAVPFIAIKHFQSMNTLKAFDDPIFLLPKAYEKETFPDFLKEIYSRYLEVLDQIDEGSIVEKLKLNRNKLASFCQTILESINTYYLGFPAKAYDEFVKAMSFIDEFLFPQKGGQVARIQEEPFYRARPGKELLYERKDMFHMPFEKRENVTTQRFSIPGLPCLYLSNSVYACWEELDRPDINIMQVTRLKLENPRLKFLDLSLSPSYLIRLVKFSTSKQYLQGRQSTGQALDGKDYLTLNFLMKWPLIAACSIKVRKVDGTFKPEYVFPQFLLQWVRYNKNIDGIKYFSVKTNFNSKHDFSRFANYAFPVKEIKTEGLCGTLSKSFSMTETVSWEMLSLANPDIVLHDQEKMKKAGYLGSDNIGAWLEFIKGKEMIYWRTKFGKIEIELAHMDFEMIQC